MLSPTSPTDGECSAWYMEFVIGLHQDGGQHHPANTLTSPGPLISISWPERESQEKENNDTVLIAWDPGDLTDCQFAKFL